MGFRPRKEAIYRVALIHKSAGLKYSRDALSNNERLEFLGDAILDAVVAEYLFDNYRDQDEGFLTKARSKIVKRKHLDTLAQKIGLHKLIRYRSYNKNHKHIFGNALEALVGAIYLDKGYNKTKRFIVKRLINNFMDINSLMNDDSDYKSRLIEWGQKHKKTVLFESFEKYSDLYKNPTFGSYVEVDGLVMGEGEGRSKKDAEQQAAGMVWDKIYQHGNDQEGT